jgi:hypothetical protein
MMIISDTFISGALKQQPDPQKSCTSTIQLQEGAEASEGQDAETNGRHPSSE